MTAVRSVDSAKYGAKLFASVLLAVAVGGGLLAFGYSLAWPELLDVAPGPPAVAEPTTVAAGAVLGVLGVFVVGVGLFGAVHKLVADGVAAGLDAAEVPAGAAEAAAAGPAGEPAEERAEGGAADSQTGETAREPETEGAEATEDPATHDEDSGGATEHGTKGSEPRAGPEEGPATGPAVGSIPGVGAGPDPPEPAAQGTEEGTAAPEESEASAGTGTGEASGGEESLGAVDVEAMSGPPGSEGDDVDAGGDGPPTTRVEDRETRVEPDPAETPGGADRGESAEDGTAGGGDPGPDSAEPTLEDIGTEPVDPAGRDEPREPSPEEIAFGSSGGGDGPGTGPDVDEDGWVPGDRDPVEEPAGTFDPGPVGESGAGEPELPEESEGSGDGEPAGSGGADPLADPNDE